MSAAPPHILILAGSFSKKINPGLPDILNQVFYRPMIQYTVDAALALPHRSVALVVGQGERELREQCRTREKLLFFRQEGRGGTAAAVQAAEKHLKGQDGDVLVLSANFPLQTARSLRGLLARHAESGAACTAAVAELDEPDGHSRLPPPKDGWITDIRMETECSDEELELRDVVGGAYVFRIADLLALLPRVEPRGPDAERSLTDAPAVLAASGAKTAAFRLRDPAEAIRVADLHELWRAESVLRDRRNRELMRAGVHIQDPRTTLVDPRSRVSPGVLIEAGCSIVNAILEHGVKIEACCRISDAEIGAGTHVKQGTRVEQSRVGRHCVVGPYANLRPGSVLEDDVRVGNFVEIKNAALGSGTRAAHLSFIGDAQVGRNVNLGCGFITCNNSGRPLKQRTVIEDDVFIGSASQAIAPVTLGRGSFVATGTTVTDSVPPESFVISRGRQVTKPGYAKKYSRTT